MNSNNNEFKSSFIISMFIFIILVKKLITLSTIPNYASHLKNPNVLMLTPSKPYIVLLLQ